MARTGFHEVADRVFIARYPQWDVNVGLVLGRYQLDYGMIPHAELGYTQKIGFSVNFQ